MRATVVLLIATCVFVLALAGPAVAAPPTGPMSIVTHGFETTPTPPTWISEPVTDTVHQSTAYWGRMSNVRRTGTFSLWCAGMRANDTPNSWGTYPARTKGVARLNLPQLADYYSSEAAFFYTMPSIGAADAFSFGLWVDGTEQSGPWESITQITGSNAWVQRNFKLSSAFSERNLSRRPGHVWFQFFDFSEGPAQLPTTGQGPSIDDVAITGYKYGPVRDLSASSTSTAGVTLTWIRPHRSTAATSAEERVVNYMIWRRPLGTATWTEVTRVGDDATSWQDTTAIADTQYEYSVYAVDPLPGTGWGKGAASVTGIRPSSIAAFTMTPNFLTLEHRWPVMLSYRIQNISVGTTISAIGLRDSFDAITGADVPATLGPGQTAVIQRVRFPSVSGQVTATMTADTESESLTVTVGAFITRKAPPARVSGIDRLSTALKVANQVYPPGGARNVIIATGWDYPDALSASALAGVKDGPVLLVNRTSATSEVLQAIRDLKATHAYVIGGRSVVADQVVAEIDALSGVSVTRIAGANRAATARDVALRVQGVRPANTVFLATGWNFPDALAASSLAANQGWPILLTRPDVLSPEADAALRAIKPSRVVILGGTSAVSSAIEDAIGGNAAYGSPAVTRTHGRDRYITAKALWTGA